MAWTKFKSLGEEHNEQPLAIRYEGLYIDNNYRDIGKSINGCLAEDIFKKDVVHRAAGWFSGWSCSNVGNPDVIFSLNYSPIKKERFFCHEPDGKIIGKYYNDEIVLNDLEFISNWENEKIRIPTCLFYPCCIVGDVSTTNCPLPSQVKFNLAPSFVEHLNLNSLKPLLLVIDSRLSIKTCACLNHMSVLWCSLNLRIIQEACGIDFERVWPSFWEGLARFWQGFGRLWKGFQNSSPAHAACLLLRHILLQEPPRCLASPRGASQYAGVPTPSACWISVTSGLLKFMLLWKVCSK